MLEADHGVHAGEVAEPPAAMLGEVDAEPCAELGGLLERRRSVQRAGAAGGDPHRQPLGLAREDGGPKRAPELVPGADEGHVEGVVRHGRQRNAE